VSPVGLYDLDRHMRPVGRAYQRLIKSWREVLPTQSVCLRVPVQLPSDQKPTASQADVAQAAKPMDEGEAG
jgi:beta-glucosidase